MKSYLLISKIFFDWWFTSLLSCLPLTWQTNIARLKKKNDLIFLHQGNTIFVHNVQGKIIDSISSSDNDFSIGAELGNIADLSDGDENLALIKNNIDLSAGDCDINFAPETNVSLDFDLSDDKTVLLDKEVKKGYLKPLNIPEDLDNTIFIDNDNDSTQLIDFGEMSEDETIIIKEDQGGILNIAEKDTDSADVTVLFRNVGGEIQKVNASSDEEDTNNEDALSFGFNDVKDDGINSYKVVAKLLEKYQADNKCVYLIPDNKVFTLKLNYPIQAIQNIENVLRFDLEKHIPIALTEIRYYYILNINNVTKQVNVDVVVIKSDEFELLNYTLMRFIEKGLFCTTKHYYEKVGSKINFVEKNEKSKWNSLLNFANIHRAVNIALLVFMLGLPYYLLNNSSEYVDYKSTSELKKARELIVSLNRANTETKFSLAISNEFNSKIKLTELLAVMSKAIDEQAWLSRYSFNKSELRIKGEAFSATKVSDDLSETGLFKNIKFVSSIVKNPRTDKESFELLLRLKNDAKFY